MIVVDRFPTLKGLGLSLEEVKRVLSPLGTVFFSVGKAADEAADGHGDDALTAVLAQLGDRLVPLVYTRAYLVTRGQLAGMVLAYDGTPLLGRAGWVEVSPEAQP